MKKINKDVSINLRQKTALYKVKDKIIDRINYIEPNKYKKIIYEILKEEVMEENKLNSLREWVINWNNNSRFIIF